MCLCSGCDRWKQYARFVMQVLYGCVFCASCGSPQFCMTFCLLMLFFALCLGSSQSGFLAPRSLNSGMESISLLYISDGTNVIG